MYDSNSDKMKEYEEHARGNESLRDQMDGHLNEPRLEKSMENSTENQQRDPAQSMG